MTPSGLRDKEAEGVYAQAAMLFRNGDRYELRAVVQRLKTQYADSAAAADPQRKPSLAELRKRLPILARCFTYKRTARETPRPFRMPSTAPPTP